MTETTTQTPTAPAPPKAPKSYTVRLVSGQEEVLIVAYQTAKGWQVSATIYRTKAAKGAKRVGEKGASSTHANLAAAKTAVETAAKAFVAKGWARPEKRSFGFAARPDSFTLASIPEPGKK